MSDYAHVPTCHPILINTHIFNYDIWKRCWKEIAYILQLLYNEKVICNHSITHINDIVELHVGNKGTLQFLKVRCNKQRLFDKSPILLSSCKLIWSNSLLAILQVIFWKHLKSCFKVDSRKWIEDPDIKNILPLLQDAQLSKVMLPHIQKLTRSFLNSVITEHICFMKLIDLRNNLKYLMIRYKGAPLSKIKNTYTRSINLLVKSCIPGTSKALTYCNSHLEIPKGPHEKHIILREQLKPLVHQTMELAIYFNILSCTNPRTKIYASSISMYFVTCTNMLFKFIQVL